MKLTVKRRQKDLLITLRVPWKRRSMSEQERANRRAGQRKRAAKSAEGAEST